MPQLFLITTFHTYNTFTPLLSILTYKANLNEHLRAVRFPRHTNYAKPLTTGVIDYRESEIMR